MTVKKKVLLVDDDEMNGNLLKKRLEKRGFDCLFVTNAKDCYDIVELEKIDLILLDVMMPDVSGIEVLKKIRETMDGVKLPIIMATARDYAKDIIEALHEGANDYLTKPVNVDVAIARINTQLRLKELFEESIKSEAVRTINTMVTTLNHEINNPLAIAIGNLSLGMDRIDEGRVSKALGALDRITTIVKKIERITSGEMEEVNYSANTNMFKLE